MKTKRLKAHLTAARAYAELSHAKRLKVGAVLIKDDRIISIGYNGMPSGGSNECEEAHQSLNLLDQVTAIEWKTKPEVCHAELNAIAFAAKNGVSTDECSLVITDSPCYECCKLLIQAGIKEVYYDREYRDLEPLWFLEMNKVKVKKLEFEDG